MIASSLDADLDVFARKQRLQLLLQRGDRRLDDEVVLRARRSPQTIRLIVPGALPSIRISRGCTTVASATAGLVTAMRVMSKSVVSTVDRPAVSDDPLASCLPQLLPSAGCAPGGEPTAGVRAAPGSRAAARERRGQRGLCCAASEASSMTLVSSTDNSSVRLRRRGWLRRCRLGCRRRRSGRRLRR